MSGTPVLFLGASGTPDMRPLFATPDATDSRMRHVEGGCNLHHRCSLAELLPDRQDDLIRQLRRPGSFAAWSVRGSEQVSSVLTPRAGYNVMRIYATKMPVAAQVPGFHARWEAPLVEQLPHDSVGARVPPKAHTPCFRPTRTSAGVVPAFEGPPNAFITERFADSLDHPPLHFTVTCRCPHRSSLSTVRD